MTAVGARRRAPRVHPVFPTALEKRYQRRLVQRTAAAHALLMGHLDRLLSARRRAEVAAEKAARADAAPPSLQDFIRAVEEVQRAYEEGSPPSEKELNETARQLDLFTTRDAARVIEEVAAITLGPTPALTDLYKAWTRTNVDLITSISSVYFDEIKDKVYDAVRTGRSTADLISDLQQRYMVSRARAELIARDQIGKLNGQITEARQRAVGVKRYRWSSSHDERVRPTHRVFDGQIYAWDDPPPEGHPGEPIQCRCSAIPVWDEEEAAAPLTTSLAPLGAGEEADGQGDDLDGPRLPDGDGPHAPGRPAHVLPASWQLPLPRPPVNDLPDPVAARDIVCMQAPLHDDPERVRVPFGTVRLSKVLLPVGDARGQVRTVLVNPRRLEATQEGVRIRTLLSLLDRPTIDPDPIAVVDRVPTYADDAIPLVVRQANGRLAIFDGHHRLAVALLAGCSRARVNLWTGPTREGRSPHA